MYRKDGLVIVGVHSPEFAFEHVPSYVRAAVQRLGIHYPVALDDEFGTWTAYQNEYWPAKYRIDRTGRAALQQEDATTRRTKPHWQWW